MIKARVLVPLNIRTGTPEILPHNNTGDKYYDIGEVIEIVDTVIGDPYKNSNVWYKLTDGSFVWSGGVDGFYLPSGVNAWWLKNSLYSVPDLWKENTKHEIRVAVLDTGISDHVDFNFSKIQGFDYIKNSERYKTDVKGHGTHCAGIIAAQGKKIFGVAPGTHLFEAKVGNDAGIPQVKAIRDALTDIYQGTRGADNISIINMSFGLIVRNAEENEIKKEIQEILIKLSTEKKCLLVASSGSIEDRKDSFPSLLAECVAVGCLTSNLRRHPSSRKTITLDIMAPGEEILSSNGSDGVAPDSGTSQAAAFISGVLALILQKTNALVIDAELIKKALYSTSFSDSFLLEEYGHGIVNPNKFFEALKHV